MDIAKDMTPVTDCLDAIDKATSTVRAEINRYIQGRDVAHTALHEATGIISAMADMIARTLPTLKIGDTVKVYLKGESPWASVSSIEDGDTMTVRIINRLVNTEAHGIQYGDEVVVILSPIKRNHGQRIWVHPAPKSTATSPTINTTSIGVSQQDGASDAREA